MTREGRFGRDCPRPRAATGEVAAPPYSTWSLVDTENRFDRALSLLIGSITCRDTILVATVLSMVSKAVAASVLAGVFTAALTLPAVRAAAYCDAADCVPNVARNVMPGGPCEPQHFNDYGLDAGSRPFVCTLAGVWVPTGPLVGLREVALPCAARNDAAQQPDGAALVCAQVNGGLRWVFRGDTPG